MEVNFTNLMRKAGEMLKYARFLWREGKSEREVGDDEKQNFKTGLLAKKFWRIQDPRLFLIG